MRHTKYSPRHNSESGSSNFLSYDYQGSKLNTKRQASLDISALAALIIAMMVCVGFH